MRKIYRAMPPIHQLHPTDIFLFHSLLPPHTQNCVREFIGYYRSIRERGICIKRRQNLLIPILFRLRSVWSVDKHKNKIAKSYSIWTITTYSPENRLLNCSFSPFRYYMVKLGGYSSKVDDS